MSAAAAAAAQPTTTTTGWLNGDSLIYFIDDDDEVRFNFGAVPEVELRDATETDGWTDRTSSKSAVVVVVVVIVSRLQWPPKVKYSIRNGLLYGNH